MKAFGVGASNDSSYVTQWTCKHYLPQVECKACGETSWDENLWYPTVGLGPKADPSSFSDELVVSASEFKTLKKTLRANNTPLDTIFPGGGIGAVSAKTTGKRTDFLWCGGKPLISERALALLAEHGVEFKTEPVLLSLSDRKSGYHAVQVPPAAMYSRRTLKNLTLARCKKCGYWHLENIRTNLRGPREYLMDCFPRNEPLVRVAEGGETLASQGFMDAVRTVKLTGIEFRERGTFAG